MNDKVHVVMAADKAYEKGLEVAKASMIGSCSDPSRLDFHIFTADPALMDRIRRDFGTYKGSPMAFLRLYLGELLPEVDWVVYSDVDTLWRRDVLVLPTLSETYGLVVAEALERGKRVITTDGAPLWECLEGGSQELGFSVGYGGRLIYLKGYRDGGADKRIELLKKAIAAVNRDVMIKSLQGV